RRFRRLAGELSLRRPGQTPFALDRFDVTGDAGRTAGSQLVAYPCAAQARPWVCAPRAADDLAAALHDALDGVSGLHAGTSTLPGGGGAVAPLLPPHTAPP